MGRLEERIQELAGRVARGLGVELDDVRLAGQGRRSLLKITIYKEGGVGVADCAAFSKDVGALLDVEDVMSGPYMLEVSSPGLDRPLKEPRDFRRHMGELVRMTLREKAAGRSSFTGRVEDVSEDHVSLGVGDETVEVSYENILKAVLEIEIG